MSSSHYFAILPAAGSGNRMGGDIPKQYLPLNGRPVIEHTLSTLLSLNCLQKIIVVIDRHDQHWQKIAFADHPKVALAYGGRERYHSVQNGLQALADFAAADDWVLVHDAARPCLKLSDVENLINTLRDHPVGGLLGTRVRDTIKQCNEQGAVQHTPDRKQFWHALTPQMFRYQLLQQALSSAIDRGLSITDDASAIELAGHTPVMVEACSSNIKITRAEDLPLAEMFIGWV